MQFKFSKEHLQSQKSQVYFVVLSSWITSAQQMVKRGQGKESQRAEW